MMEIEGSKITDRVKLKIEKMDQIQARLEKYDEKCTSSNDDLVSYEISSVEELIDPSAVFERLLSLDWEFKDDDTSYLTHDIHPYPAKFIPQIPAQLISYLSLRGDMILDPFGGSGTMALEALRLGRRAISVDANPIGSLIGTVKTTKLSKQEISELHELEISLKHEQSTIDEKTADLSMKYSSFIPNIPNIEKWFSRVTCVELAQISYYIDKIKSQNVKNIALLALSRIVISVSFQDSETRYVSKTREVKVGEAIKKYIDSLNFIIHRVLRTEPYLHYGITKFITADTKKVEPELIPDESIDLIVTSPPYGNAYDYHLYHRFRLIWLGFNPANLSKIEIGSHLRHQKENSGFESYVSEMSAALQNMFRQLRSGRYAALVIGDSIYNGQIYDSAEAIANQAKIIGFNYVGIITRSIHQTKRSVTSAGRRAKTEKILILQKPLHICSATLTPPPYKLKKYEKVMQKREIETLLHAESHFVSDKAFISTEAYNLHESRRLTFIHNIESEHKFQESTWQAKLENGLAIANTSRKEPKYVTHGIHPYKGKFYPQLAKALINISGVAPGAIVLDPFCGSGTTLLEGYLNGLRTYGCDMNPLAAKIALAKTGILEVDPDKLAETISILLTKTSFPSENLNFETDQFEETATEELNNWFAKPVIAKINWILKSIRSVSSGVTRDFFEVILSSIIRDVSQQEPRDLRIRRRKEHIEDADVFGIFQKNLELQYSRISKFWSVRGYSPFKLYPSHVAEGDSRLLESFTRLQLKKGSVDLILTSPPYATALPYIDTDRLSLLVLFGLTSSKRRPLEHNLIGSREITPRDRREFEEEININSLVNLPDTISSFLISLQSTICGSTVGFRRQNIPSLLLRFFIGIEEVLSNCFELLKPGGEIMIVIGDNSTIISDEIIRIPTTDFTEDIAKFVGFDPVEQIPITVTTENLIHIKNAITKNVVLRLKKPVQ